MRECPEGSMEILICAKKFEMVSPRVASFSPQPATETLRYLSVGSFRLSSVIVFFNCEQELQLFGFEQCVNQFVNPLFVEIICTG